MLLAACAMLPTVWLPDLKALSYLGFLGVGATLTVLCAVGYTYVTGAAPAPAAQLLTPRRCAPLWAGYFSPLRRASVLWLLAASGAAPGPARAARANGPRAGRARQAASRRARSPRRPTGPRCRSCSASWPSCTPATACSPASSAA